MANAVSWHPDIKLTRSNVPLMCGYLYLYLCLYLCVLVMRVSVCVSEGELYTYIVQTFLI